MFRTYREGFVGSVAVVDVEAEDGVPRQIAEPDRQIDPLVPGPPVGEVSVRGPDGDVELVVVQHDDRLHHQGRKVGFALVVPACEPEQRVPDHLLVVGFRELALQRPDLDAQVSGDVAAVRVVEQVRGIVKFGHCRLLIMCSTYSSSKSRTKFYLKIGNHFSTHPVNLVMIFFFYE